MEIEDPPVPTDAGTQFPQYFNIKFARSRVFACLVNSALYVILRPGFLVKIIHI